MNKLFASLLIAAAVGSSTVATQALPLGGNRAQDGLVVLVAGGCGVGFHRGPYGGCRANGYYGGRYWGTPVVVAPGSSGGSWRTMRWTRPASCLQRHGGCWMVCN
ncbi:MAG: hypothetical protein WAN49_16820 [Pseudolabrys sp.]